VGIRQVAGLDGCVDLGQLQRGKLPVHALQVGAQEDHALQPALQEQAARSQDGVGLLIKDVHHKHKAAASPGLHDLLGQVGQKGVAPTQQDDADGGGALLLEVAGGLVAHIVELPDHRPYPRPGARVHVPAVIEHAGNRGDADPGGLGDILDGDYPHPCSSCSLFICFRKPV